MNNLHIRKDDTVAILSGKDVGKTGKVLATEPKTGMVLVEGVNMVSRHTKPRRQGEAGGIIKREGYIHGCKVMRVCPKCSKPTRLAHTFAKDGSKVRVCKKCGAQD